MPTDDFVQAAAVTFVPPDQVEISIPDNLGRPPTSRDVTVVKGFDGKTPAEVLRIVRQTITNPIHARNDALVAETVIASHKAFTLGVANIFAPSSPPALSVATILAASPGATLTMLGVMSAVNPTALQVTPGDGGAARYYVLGPGGAYRETPSMRYAVIMRCAIQRTPPGVAIDYPAWSLPALGLPPGGSPSDAGRTDGETAIGDSGLGDGGDAQDAAPPSDGSSDEDGPVSDASDASADGSSAEPHDAAEEPIDASAEASDANGASSRERGPAEDGGDGGKVPGFPEEGIAENPSGRPEPDVLEPGEEAAPDPSAKPEESKPRMLCNVPTPFAQATPGALPLALALLGLGAHLRRRKR